MILDQLNDILYNTDHQDLNHLIAKYLKKFLQVCQIGTLKI